MLNFDFLENGLGLVCPSYFVYDFSRKMLFNLYSISIKWPKFIVCLLLLLEILINMCIEFFCFRGCEVIILELTLSF